MQDNYQEFFIHNLRRITICRRWQISSCKYQVRYSQADLICLLSENMDIGNNVSWFVYRQETWLGNNVSWFVHLHKTWLGNNVSWFVHLQETWLGNNVSWFVNLIKETWLGSNVSKLTYLRKTFNTISKAFLTNMFSRIPKVMCHIVNPTDGRWEESFSCIRQFSNSN